MKIANSKSKSLLLTAMVVGLVHVSSLYAAEKSWEDDTVLISPQGDQTVVQAFKGRKVLLKNADPQRVIEWGMANARATVVLAGKYVASDRIDVPRDNVTLIIDRGAEVSLNPETKHTSITPGFLGSDGKRYPITATIYVKQRNNVRVLQFGSIPGPGIFFDGKNEKNMCGINGGLVVLTGASTSHPVSLNDCRGIQVPLAVSDKDVGAVMGMEGCERCSVGTLIHIAGKPGGKTGEGIDSGAHRFAAYRYDLPRFAEIQGVFGRDSWFRKRQKTRYLKDLEAGSIP